MKATLITTVKNEGKTIERFLDSVLKQTRKPDEIIIVDGGSKDKTIRLIKRGVRAWSIPVKIIKKKGNRSVGRNTAIKNSSNEVIAVTDGGCILDKNWLERITKPFEDKRSDVVSGFYKPKTENIFEKCLATYTCTMPDRLNKKKFLPSSRSVAFRKEAWRKAGGYPENLDTCEDLVFDKKLKKANFKFITVPSAFVYWPQRRNIFSAAKQFSLYAFGDGKARYIRFSTPFLFARYILGLSLIIFMVLTGTYEITSLLILLIAVYITWSIQKNYKYVKNWRAFFYLPLLQFISDFCVITGTTIGFITR